MSCRPRTSRSTHDPQCTSSPSLPQISLTSPNTILISTINPTYKRQIPRIAAASAPAPATSGTQTGSASSQQQKSIGAQPSQQSVEPPFLLLCESNRRRSCLELGGFIDMMRVPRSRPASRTLPENRTFSRRKKEGKAHRERHHSSRVTMLYEMIGVVCPAQCCLAASTNTMPGPARPPLRSQRNRKDRRHHHPLTTGRRPRLLQLGHLSSSQAREEAANDTSLRTPLYHALRRECARTARLEKDDESGSAANKILGGEDGREV